MFSEDNSDTLVTKEAAWAELNPTGCAARCSYLMATSDIQTPYAADRTGSSVPHDLMYS